MGYIKIHGYAPSYREIAEGVKIKSTNTINYHVCSLIKEGYLETDHPGSPRALRTSRMVEDIWQVLRQRIYLDNGGDPNGWCVDARPPLQMSDEPLRIGDE